MSIIRKSVVAGAFYPGNSDILKMEIENYLSKVKVKDTYEKALGIVSPHAGYVYSGQCAAYGYKAIEQKNFDLAVIIAPSHNIAGYRFSVGNFDAYQTPLGIVPVEKEYVRKILDYPDFEFLPAAHSSEHSLEVQLPFLQVIKPNVEIVPIILGNQNSKNSVILSEVLSRVFKNRLDKTVFIISSDLSHYYDSDTAIEKDNLLAENFQKGLIDKMEQDMHYKKIEACGIGGILFLMHLAEKLKYKKIETLKYTHSGYINNDFSQVVGYLSSIIYK